MQTAKTGQMADSYKFSLVFWLVTKPKPFDLSCSHLIITSKLSDRALNRGEYLKFNQRTNGPVNAHLTIGPV